MGFGSTTEDQDGLPKGNALQELERGPIEEMAMTEDELRRVGTHGLPGDLKKQMDVMKRMFDEMVTMHNHLINEYGTLRNEFRQYQAQRVKELQSWVAKNGGSTTPEDH